MPEDPPHPHALQLPEGPTAPLENGLAAPLENCPGPPLEGRTSREKVELFGGSKKRDSETHSTGLGGGTATSGTWERQKRKEAIQRRSIKLSTGIKWQWLHKSGYRDFYPADIARIELAFQRGDSKVRIKSGKGSGTPMELFFVDLIQYDPTSKHSRPIQRVGPNSCLSRIRRYFAEYYRAWETGRVRRETFDMYQIRRETLDLGEEKHVYDVTDYYYPMLGDPDSLDTPCFGGLCSGIAQSRIFFAISMAAVLSNAIWLAVDADLNPDYNPNSTSPHWIFVLVEHIFCGVFTLELMVRFFAFRGKCNCFKDGWFKFDLALVTLMVLETWVQEIVFLSIGLDGGGKSQLRNFSILRLARLLRLSRMTRLLRAMPEVLTLLKGIATALRSVFFTMLLLGVLVFIFAVIFRTQMQDVADEVKDTYFSDIFETMWTLMMHGCLLDAVSDVLNDIKRDRSFQGYMFCIIFLCFIFLAALTVMNMLIGIICEVVSKISAQEKEKSETNYLRNSLMDIIECYDKNGDRHIGKKEFELLMENPEVRDALTRFGTDVEGLRTMVPMIFNEGSEDSKRGQLSFEEFLETILRLRGDHSVKVTDIVQLREYTCRRLNEIENVLRKGQQDVVTSLVDALRSGPTAASALDLTTASPMGCESSSKFPTLRNSASPREAPALPLGAYVPGRPVVDSVGDVITVRLTLADVTKVQLHAASLSIDGLLQQVSPRHGRLAAVNGEGVLLGSELTLGQLAARTLLIHADAGAAPCGPELVLHLVSAKDVDPWCSLVLEA